jgi:hypothetical protein
MAKYKLTVKYSGVCELSIAGDIPDIIQSEFDQYVKSILYKKEEWENFETNFKEAAKLEYGDPNHQLDAKEEDITNADNNETIEEIKEEPITEIQEQNETADCTETESTLSEEKENSTSGSESVKTEEAETKAAPVVEEKKGKRKKTRMELISLGEYIQGKKISTPLDEFVAGACYLDEILNIKEFSLKQINAKLYPVFKRLASSIVIKEAIERVLIETIKDGDKLRYSINQNAWNYHNYDLVGQK